MRYELTWNGGAVRVHRDKGRVTLRVECRGASTQVVLSARESAQVAEALRAAADAIHPRPMAYLAPHEVPGGQTRPGPVDQAREGR